MVFDRVWTVGNEHQGRCAGRFEGQRRRHQSFAAIDPEHQIHGLFAARSGGKQRRDLGRRTSALRRSQPQHKMKCEAMVDRVRYDSPHLEACSRCPHACRTW